MELAIPPASSFRLVLWWLLARQGIASDLRVGIRKDGDRFEAHAWVECGGATMNETETPHHHFAAFDTALASLPPEPQGRTRLIDLPGDEARNPTRQQYFE